MSSSYASASYPTRQYGEEIIVEDDLPYKLAKASESNGLNPDVAAAGNNSTSDHRFGTVVHDAFWLDDVSILFKPDRLGEFIPCSSTQTINEQLNACSRFFIFLGVLLALKRKSAKPLVGVVAVPLAFIVYYFIKNVASLTDHDHRGDATDHFTPLASESIRPRGILRPTKNNPFMNPDPTMYGTSDYLLKPADVNDPAVQKEIIDAFDSDLWKDSDDLFDRKQGQLLFNTVPRQLDFGEFQDYLYKNPEDTCKENTMRCTPSFRSPKYAQQSYTDFGESNGTAPAPVNTF